MYMLENVGLETTFSIQDCELFHNGQFMCYKNIKSFNRIITVIFG